MRYEDLAECGLYPVLQQASLATFSCTAGTSGHFDRALEPLSLEIGPLNAK